MRVLSMGFPKTLFPFRSVSQRLNLEYDEIDEIMDRLFADIFEKLPPVSAPATMALEQQLDEHQAA